MFNLSFEFAATGGIGVKAWQSGQAYLSGMRVSIPIFMGDWRYRAQWMARDACVLDVTSHEFARIEVRRIARQEM